MPAGKNVHRALSLAVVALLLVSTAMVLSFQVKPATAYVAASGDFKYIVLDATRPLLYISEFSANSVAVFNTSSDKVVKTVWVGSGPEGLDVSADGSELYVALATGSGVAVVNLTSLTLARTIHLSISPGDVAAGRLGRAYATETDVNGEDWNHPAVIDTNESRQIGNITAGGLIFSGSWARMSPDRRVLYVGDRDESPPSVYAFSVATDNVTLISKAPFDGPAGGQDMMASPDGKRLYFGQSVGLAQDGKVAFAVGDVNVVNSTDWTLMGRLQTPSSVVGGAVVEYNTTTFLPLKVFPTSQDPLFVRASSDGSTLYAVTSGQLEVLDVTAQPYLTTSTTSSAATNSTTFQQTASQSAQETTPRSSNTTQTQPAGPGQEGEYLVLGGGMAIAVVAFVLAMIRKPRPDAAKAYESTAVGGVGVQQDTRPKRELDAGEVISGTFGLYRRGFVKYFLVFLIFEAIIGVLTTLVENSVSLQSLPPVGTGPMSDYYGYLGGLLWLLLLSFVVSWVFGSIATGSAVKLTTDQLEKGQSEVGSSLRFGVTKMLPIMAVTLIAAIAVGLGLVALIVPGIILAIMFCLAVPALLVENSGAVDSLGRSRELVSHRWLKTFAIFLVFFIILIGANIVATLVGDLFGAGHTLAVALISALYLPLIPIALTVYYHSNVARLAPAPVVPQPYQPYQPQAPSMMPSASGFGYCPSCGQALMEANQSFCRRCGRDLRVNRV